MRRRLVEESDTSAADVRVHHFGATAAASNAGHSCVTPLRVAQLGQKRRGYDIVRVQISEPSGFMYVHVADGCANPSRFISGATWVRKVALNTGI